MSAKAVRRMVIAVVALVFGVALIAFVARIPRTVSVFLIAAFIAFGAYPLVRRLESRMPRPLAIALVYVALLGVLVILAVVVIPVAYAQIAALVLRAPDYVSTTQDLIAKAEGVLRVRFGSRIALPSSADMQVELGNWISGMLSGAVNSIGTVVVGTFNALFVGISALILSVFFVARGNRFGISLLEIVPPRRREEVRGLFSEIASIFGHFVAGQAFLCAVVGVAVWAVLAPVHFSFALLVAVVCALGYAVPFVGMIVAQAAAALLAIPQGGTMVAYVTIAIFIIARLADNVLVPQVMSGSVGVSPIGVMFAVFAGGELFGLPGLLLGIPAAALVKVLFKYFVQPYVVRMQIGDVGQHIDVAVDAPPGSEITIAVSEPPPAEPLVAAAKP